MKIKYLFLTALATLTLAGCTSDEFMGDQETVQTQKDANDGIYFGGGFRPMTRDGATGAAAAVLLGEKFYVTGVKGDGTGASQIEVFKTYSVEWGANTAGTTESNTSDWEYVGKTHDWTETDPSQPNYTGITSQTIKYWDFSTTAYDFCAYSLGDKTATPKAVGTIIDYANAGTQAYTLTGARNELSRCYITDMKTVAKANYGQEVTLEFRSLASKVRMALYETVPGYSVENVHFYVDDVTAIAANTTITNENATLYGTDAFYTNGTYTVTFPHIGSGNSTHPDYNKAHVSFAATANTNASSQSFDGLNYTSGKLGVTSNTATFAGAAADSYYKTMLPNEDGVVLTMRVNYDLVADDGGDEVITVHGAKALVPATYTQWKPNYAYTYLFKISDNTNGWTSLDPTDKQGLFPITFDAVVLDPISSSTEQTTITTVAMPTITTYQKGHVWDASNEYTATASATDSIYVQVMCADPDDATSAIAVRTDLNTKGKLYVVTSTTGATISEATVMDALNIQESEASGTITGRNGLVLAPIASANYQVATGDATFGNIPASDGNHIPVAANAAARFKAAASTIYAFVYDATPTAAPASTYIYTAVATTSQPDGWTTDGVWYIDPNGATSAYNTAWSAGTYYKKYTNLNKVLGVKVIKVQ